MSYASLFVGMEKSVRCGSLCNERTHPAPISVTTESSRSRGEGGGLACGVMIQCNKCNVQYFGRTKRHLSDRFVEQRRAIEKAIVKQHIDQPTAVTDHFTPAALGTRLNVTPGRGCLKAG